MSYRSFSHFFYCPSRHEDHLIISGLTRAPSGLTTQEWQIKAKQDVSGVASILVNRDCPIVVVHNQTGQKKVTSYLVKMESVKDSREIRAAFGKYFAGGRDSRPAALKAISISNWTTPGTKVRIAVLKVMAARYRSANPGSRVQVLDFICESVCRVV